MSHPASVYNTLGQLLSDCCGEIGSPGYEKKVRFWTKIWKKHVDKHGNVPYIMKCAVCSGAEHKHDIKCGKFKVSTREANKLLKEEIEERG